MKLLTSSICKQGGREYNQDYLDLRIEADGGCMVVCDGLGSYYGSEVASRICASKIVDTYAQIKALDPERAVRPEFCQSYIQTAHNCVVDEKERNPKIKSSCTTVACVVTNFRTTIMSHIGDTRIYFFKNKKLHYQTKDHSLSQIAVEMGQIPLRDIRSHKDQNKLTRVLGSDYYLPPDCDIYNTPLQPGDCFILCTDGFWEYVYEDEMEEDLFQSETPDEALARMEARLLERVNKYNDNYSAIVAMVVDGGVQQKPATAKPNGQPAQPTAQQPAGAAQPAGPAQQPAQPAQPAQPTADEQAPEDDFGVDFDE